MLPLLCAHISFGQSISLSGTINVGISQVDNNLPFGESYHIGVSPSGSIGFVVERKISKRSGIGISVQFVQIEGVERFKNNVLLGVDPITGEFTEIGELNEVTRIHSSYLAFPIFYKLQLNRLAITTGVQPMMLLTSSANSVMEGVLSGEPFRNESDATTEDMNFDKIDFGVRAGLSYQLSEVLSLQTDFYYGLSDITNRNFPFQRRNYQLTVGINYTFKTIE